jgi:Flp pilus assembly protein TadD
VGLISDLLLLESIGSRPRDQDAEIIADEALRGRPRDAQLAYNIGETFFRNGRLAPARRFLKAAFDIDQQDGIALRYLDSLLVRENPSLNEAERILAVLARPKDRVSENAGFLMAAARLRIQQERRGEAASAAVAALRTLDPNIAQQMMGWNSSMREVLDKPEQRRAFYENAISQGVAPNATEWLAYFRGRIDVDAESTLESGLRTFREILRSSKNPSLRLATFRTMGATLYTFGRFQEAVDAMKPGLDEFPEDIEMLNNTSFMLSKKLNNPALALPIAERAAKLAPTNADVLDTLGVTLLLVGRAADAEVQLRQALSNPSSPQSEIIIAVHLIDALLKQQKTDEAKQLATKAQEFITRLGAQADPAIVAELQQLRTTGGI